MPAVDFDNLTLREAVALFRSSQVSSISLVQETLRRAHARPELNAFASLDEKGALDAAATADAALKSGIPPSRLLEGIPVLIKDNIHVRGMPNSAGTPALAHFTPTEDAPVVARLRAAGAIFIGKSSMHEMACGATGYNPLYRAGGTVGTRNAYDVSRISGGSSSGNGAALGARIVTAAMGSDTGGSVRIPAAFNGVASLRPTAGRYSQKGVTPICHTRDTVGPMAQTVADVELLDRVVSGEPEVTAVPSLKGIRLGITDFFNRNVDAETADFMLDVVALMKRAGVEIVEVDMPTLGPLNDACGFALIIGEHYDDVAAYLKDYCPDVTVEQLTAQLVSPEVREWYTTWTIPRKMPAEGGEGGGSLIDVGPVYERVMREERPALQQLYRDVFAQHRLDGLVYSTMPRLAVEANEAATSLANLTLLIQNMSPSSVAGVPSMSIPVSLGKTSGMPMSICIDGMENGDRRLLSVGMALEKVFGRMPPPPRVVPG
ncbi:Mandelamide hydrolase [Hypsibius exemplaris]|uniref:Mandelamide hydrolase n=1 Tax=Hypsibius exemplaris TaxID=2072580 RepID=A0A1W0WJD9_HYPEX|nr:Mandelamide hydrolase [Hypsibius exemplaris]